MPRVGSLGRQLRSRIWKTSAEDEVSAELAFHIEMRRRELIAQGMSPEGALKAAVERFGNFSQVSAACETIANERDQQMQHAEYVSELRQDIRIAFRQLRFNPAFTVIAVLALSLGIGATTAIFSAVQAVVLRPFSFANQDRVMLVAESRGAINGEVSAGNYIDWQAQTRGFEQLSAASRANFNVAQDGSPERVSGAYVTWNFFATFGARPLLGRFIAAAEDQPGHEQVVVLSHALWLERFGGSETAIGQTLRINDRPFTVIGVAEQSFDPQTTNDQLWVPIAFTPERRQLHDEHYLTVYGLVRKGVSLEQLQQELDIIAAEQRRRFPLDNGDQGIRATSLATVTIGEFRERLFVMMGAVSLVLCIACGNIANLLLARGAAREKELAIRAAIGAGRGRIVRQLMAESGVLAAGGTVGGLVMAWVLIRVLVAAAPPNIPRIEQTRIDGVVVLFAVGAALLSAMLFGLAPALRASRTNLQASLKDRVTHAVTRSSEQARTALIAFQVALALTLLVGAGLLLRTAYNLGEVSPGFATRGILTARVTLPAVAYREGSDQAVATFERMVTTLRQMPEVRAASLSSQVPTGPGGGSNGLLPEGRTLEQKNLIMSRMRIVMPGYFDVMGMTLVRGRDFTEQDSRSTPLGMIVSERLAREAWPNENPIGKRIACCEGSDDDPKWKTVIGVVRDVRSNGPQVEPRPEFYVPIRQVPPAAWSWIQRSVSIVARGESDNTSSLAAVMRKAVQSVDPTVPVYRVSTMDDLFRQTTATSRFHTMLLVTLGVIGLLLASIGIYGTIAYFVSLRTHEIGIRMALGATSGTVLGLMLWQGLRPILAGAVLGTLGAWWASRLLESSLFGVTANDPWTFGVVVGLFVLVGLAATWIPAHRATKVDPVIALGH